MTAVMIVKTIDTALTPAGPPTDFPADPLATRTFVFSPRNGRIAPADPGAAPCGAVFPIPTAGGATIAGESRPDCGAPRAGCKGGACACACACPASPGKGATGMFCAWGSVPGRD